MSVGGGRDAEGGRSVIFNPLYIRYQMRNRQIKWSNFANQALYSFASSRSYLLDRSFVSEGPHAHGSELLRTHKFDQRCREDVAEEVVRFDEVVTGVEVAVMFERHARAAGRGEGADRPCHPASAQSKFRTILIRSSADLVPAAPPGGVENRKWACFQCSRPCLAERMDPPHIPNRSGIHRSFKAPPSTPPR